jgi:hypothetical protein
MSAPDRHRLNRWIHRALFAPIDPVATALFRIALAGMVVFTFWPMRLPPPWPADPTFAQTRSYLHTFLSGAYGMAIVALAVLLALGLRPRLTGSILTVLLLPLVPFEGRRPGRQVVAVTVLALSFIRSDAALAIVPRRASAPASAGPCWPIRIVQLQLSVLYGVNALAKTTPDYLSGRSLDAMMRVFPNFLIRPSEGHLDIAGATVPLWLAATGVVAIEYALAAGFWFRSTRWPTAVLGIAFHTTLRYVIRIGVLDVVSVFLYAAFLLPFEPRARQRQDRERGRDQGPG